MQTQPGHLRTWDLPVEGLSGLFHQDCQSMVLRRPFCYHLFNVNVDAIHELRFGYIQLVVYPHRPIFLVHDVREGDITFTFAMTAVGKRNMFKSVYISPTFRGLENC